MLISDYLVPKKPKKNRKIVLFGLIITGILSAALVIVTYFGFFTGTNYLLLDSELGARGIEISKYSDLSQPTSRIVIDPMSEDGLDELTDGDIDFNVRNTHDGDNEWFGPYTQKRNNVSHTFGMYQFYLINQSDPSADTDYVLNVAYFIEITRSTNNLADALGIRLFVEDYELDGNGAPIVGNTIYDSGNITEGKQQYQFPVIENLEPKEVKRITVFFWLEGNNTKQAMVGGSIRLRIRFNLAGEESESEI